MCLDTRCFWYNQAEEWRSSIDWCHKADCGTGADCRVIPNQNTLCVATYQGDIAPNLMVLDATVHLIGPNGAREMPLTEFYQLDGMTRNVLQPGEFMLKVSLPSDVSDWVGSYRKLRLRESWDFPEAGSCGSMEERRPLNTKSCYHCSRKHSKKTRRGSCRFWRRYQGDMRCGLQQYKASKQYLASTKISQKYDQGFNQEGM